MPIFLRHIIACSLSVLLLFSTISFTVGLHFCGKRLVEIAVNEHIHGCGMEGMADVVPGDYIHSAMHCCKDVQLSFNGQRDLQTVQLNTDLKPPIVAIENVSVSVFQAIVPETVQSCYKPYSPPPLIKDINILHQSFLI